MSWATWLPFTGVPARCVALRVRCPGPPGSCSPVRLLGALLRWCGVLGHLAPVQRCACSVRCFACAVSWATWLLFTCVPAQCVMLRVRCPGPLGSCSAVCPLGALLCCCGVLGHLASVRRCACLVRCSACVVSLAPWLLFTGAPAPCVALRVRCPGPLGSCSPVCPLGVLRCVCGVLGNLAPVQRCARSVFCFACVVSWATWLLFTRVPARCVLLRVPCPGPLGSCSPVRLLRVLLCWCGVLGHLAPVHRCARLVRCFACLVSWATWFLFTGVPARCVALRVRCPGPLGSCSPLCPLGALSCVCGVLGQLAPVHRCARSVCCFVGAVSWATWLLLPVCLLGALLCVCGVLGHLAPVHWCARSVRCVACAVYWANWLLITGVPARCVALRVRCLGPLGSCSLVCPRGALCCVCGVLGHLAPVHRCATSVPCFACAVSWATGLLFSAVPARCVVLRVPCPGPLGSRSPVCPLSVLCCVCSVLGHLAPVHGCVRSVRCFACAESWATWLLFTGVPAWCVALRVRCPGPLGFCSLVYSLGALLWVCGVLGHLTPVQRCACVVYGDACAVSWATWILFTGVPAWCIVLLVRCPGPLGSCSPVCPFDALFCLCGVLGNLAPVHQCGRSVCCFACAVSWATWLLLTGVRAWFVVWCVWCPRPLGSCSPVCPLGALFCVCGVLGHWAPVHSCARSVRYFACAVSSATWLLLTGVPAWFLVLRVRCPGPLGSCSPVCPLGALFCLCGVLGHLAPAHRSACSVRRFACAVSWATWLLLIVVPARCVTLRVRCPRPLGSCSPVCPRGFLCCVCGVLGHLAPVHRCARSVRCFACAVSWGTWLLFTGVPARCVALLLPCPGPLGPCSPLCLPSALLCVSGVLGHLAPVHRCARSVCCFACAVSWATWLLFTGVPARCVALRVQCPRPLGSCSLVCPLGVLLCACGVLGHLAPVHPCARSVRSVACLVSWATWLLFTGAPPRCVALLVRCPGPLGCCSPVRPLVALFCLGGVLGHLVPVHRCARSVCCVACAMSWATWLLFTSVRARCVALRVRCPWPLRSCSPVCLLCALLCLCGVLGHFAPVHQCACSVRCFACAVSWATWLLVTAVPARCVVLRVRCPGPLGSCSPVCLLGAWLCVCGVLGHLAPGHQWAHSVRCVVCAVSWAT